jgi:hypothetical protein
MSAAALAPAEATVSLPPVPREGLSLAALAAFEAEHADSTHAGVPFAALTTADVVTHVVKPATAAHGECTYAELLVQRGDSSAGRPHVAAANVFVSHAWAYSFRDLCAALRDHVANEPAAEELYFWIGAPDSVRTAHTASLR